MGREGTRSATGAASTSLSDRPVAADRARVRRQRSGFDRDALRSGQRLPGHARQPRGRPRGAQPWHLPERLSRDVAHPACRRGIRLCQDRSDDRQRARCEIDEAVRRRRATLAEHRRPGALRAHAGLPVGHPDPRPAVAHPRRQAGTCAVDSSGQPVAPASRHHDAGSHAAGLRGAGGDLVATAEPSGRRGRVPRHLRGAGRRTGPAQKPRLRTSRAAAAPASRDRRRDDAGLSLCEQRHDPGVRCAPRRGDELFARDRVVDRCRSGQDGHHCGCTPWRDGSHRQAGVVPLVHRRPAARTGRPVFAHAGPRRERRPAQDR